MALRVAADVPVGGSWGHGGPVRGSARGRTGGRRVRSLFEDPVTRDFVSRPPAHQAHIMPLDQFPDDRRREIILAALAEEKPEKWLYFGPIGSQRPLAAIESRAWYEWHWYRGIDPDRQRAPLPAWLRRAVIERDGGVCGLCGGDVDPGDIHIDHILPVSLGGQDLMENLQVAHSKCNIRKGNRV